MGYSIFSKYISFYKISINVMLWMELCFVSEIVRDKKSQLPNRHITALHFTNHSSLCESRRFQLFRNAEASYALLIIVHE